MVQDPFPLSALEANRAGRLTAEQIRGLHLDARESQRSGVTGGIALAAMGLLIVGGTLAGRVPGSRLQSFAVGVAIAAAGGLLLGSRRWVRGPRSSHAASESTRLDVVEGPFRRERYDHTTLLGSTHTTRGNARFDYLLHVGSRRLSVSEQAYNAAPDDGVVRVFLLPQSDRVVNLERIGDAPPTPVEVHASAMLRERFGADSALEPSPPASRRAGMC